MYKRQPPDVIRERVRILSDLERELAEQFYLRRVNPIIPDGDLNFLHVLVERECEARPGYVRGSDQWYMPVEVPGTAADLAQFVTCRAVSANRNGVVAERISGTVPAAGVAASDTGVAIARSILRRQSTGGLTPLRSPDFAELRSSDFAEQCGSDPPDLVQLGTPHADLLNSGVHAWPR